MQSKQRCPGPTGHVSQESVVAIGVPPCLDAFEHLTYLAHFAQFNPPLQVNHLSDMAGRHGNIDHADLRPIRSRRE
jgi:hypothetical protein